MKKLWIDSGLFVDLSEIDIKGVRASGPGGQHVNKVSSAVRLRFDIMQSSLPHDLKLTLANSGDRRISKDGVFNIKVKRFRSARKNREMALELLKEFIDQGRATKKERIPTKISKAIEEKRKEIKKKQSQKKADRDGGEWKDGLDQDTKY